MTDRALHPLAFPDDPAEWGAFFTNRVDGELEEASTLMAGLDDGSPRDAEETLECWNGIDIALGNAGALAGLLAEVHPDPEVRRLAESRIERVDELASRRGLDPALWRALERVDVAGLPSTARRVRDEALRDFRIAGVDKDAETRERLRSLAEESTRLGLEFSRNIRDGRREIHVAPERLEGLPQDFVAAHPAGPDGRVVLSTDYPDLLPVRTFAKDRSLRVELMREHCLLGFPQNLEVLSRLLKVRDEQARLTGYATWADRSAADKMVGTSARVEEFLARLESLTRRPARAETDELLRILRRTAPEATAVTSADSLYCAEILQRERFDVDAATTRSYFSFERVRDGVLAVSGRVFGLSFQPVDVPAWHEDVRVYDVYDAADGTEDAGGRIGRIYLDLHPRRGKYNHAAQFDVVTGVEGRALPEGALVCNLPKGLIDHDDVVTLFHEFGHLVHHIVGGRQHWARFSGVATEWDFVEAPSQMFEEWAWDPSVLATFAVDDAGRPIPADLVRRMRQAADAGRASWTRRQLAFSELSHRLHVHPVPATAGDVDRVASEMADRLQPFPDPEGGHAVAGFGHLEGYSSDYYTYLWSLAIAKDMFTAFDPTDLLSRDRGIAYRRAVLEPGGSADADDLVRALLGRPWSFDAFETWLAGGD